MLYDSMNRCWEIVVASSISATKREYAPGGKASARVQRSDTPFGTGSGKVDAWASVPLWRTTQDLVVGFRHSTSPCRGCTKTALSNVGCWRLSVPRKTNPPSSAVQIEGFGLAYNDAIWKFCISRRQRAKSGNTVCRERA